MSRDPAATAGRRVLALGIGVALAGATWVLLRPGSPRALPHPDYESSFPGRSGYERSEVAAEIARLCCAHEWAGEYFVGDGFTGELLCIAPQSGFARWKFWDAGPPFESVPAYGRVTVVDGTIRLHGPAPEPRGQVTEEYALVAWGERRYLVDPDEVDEFCQSVAAGSEPRSSLIGRWFLRVEPSRVDEPYEPAGSTQGAWPETCR